jgi:hypothetical protein
MLGLIGNALGLGIKIMDKIVKQVLKSSKKEKRKWIIH